MLTMTVGGHNAYVAVVALLVGFDVHISAELDETAIAFTAETLLALLLQVAQMHAAPDGARTLACVGALAVVCTLGAAFIPRPGLLYAYAFVLRTTLREPHFALDAPHLNLTRCAWSEDGSRFRFRFRLRFRLRFWLRLWLRVWLRLRRRGCYALSVLRSCTFRACL